MCRVGEGIYDGETMMETLIYSICIAICGYVIGHVIGYRRGHDDMDKIYKDVYNIKEY